MYCPAVFGRVRVNGRDGQFIIIRVDAPGSLVDLCPPVETSIERNVPFNLLSAADDYEPYCADPVIDTHAILKSSRINLRRSRATLGDLHELVRLTVDSIRSSRQRLVESDRLIESGARWPAQTPDLPKPLAH